jgi:hypothetical protein
MYHDIPDFAFIAAVIASKRMPSFLAPRGGAVTAQDTALFPKCNDPLP